MAAGVGLAILAAIGFGFCFPPMHAAGKADPFWAGLIFRMVSTAIVLVAVVARRPAVRLGGWTLLIILGVGLGDTLGNVLFGAAAGQGGLESLTSVLASLYPVVTVMLAAIVLHERVAGIQRLGAVLALTGILLIAV
jgi:drug/metabolite transporter (DMT)-like permease